MPGGQVAAAGVTSVGVRTDRRRRGYLRALMTAQLDLLHATGAVAATLRATEGAIYERFGYGVASQYLTVTVQPTSVRWRAGAGACHEPRIAEVTDALAWLPEAYDRIGHDRAGRISRPQWWWASVVSRRLDKDEPLWLLHTVDDAGAVNGWVLYTAESVDSPTGQHRARVHILDLIGSDVGVELALWRAALGIDLADSVIARGRPVDETLPLALTDARSARRSGIEDETWLRLLDVPAALAARRYGDADPVVVEVADPMFADNGGRYRVSGDGAARTDAPADIALDVSELAWVYLGGTPMTALAAAGRVTGAAEALRSADVLFGAHRAPWCGTYF